MNIDILCVGRLKEKYLKDAVAEYSKRLSRYCNLNIIETPDEKVSEDQGEAMDEKTRTAEGGRLLKHIRDDAYIITLEIEGKNLSSTELASMIYETGLKGISRIQFIIGGSIGLSDEIIKRADMHLSFSRMTFPHQLMRVVLLEQIYRSFKINSNEPYHK